MMQSDLLLLFKARRLRRATKRATRICNFGWGLIDQCRVHIGSQVSPAPTHTHTRSEMAGERGESVLTSSSSRFSMRSPVSRDAVMRPDFSTCVNIISCHTPVRSQTCRLIQAHWGASKLAPVTQAFSSCFPKPGRIPG
jgi:hypothetical protein